MSQLVDFYRGEATDTEGRRLADVWAFSNHNWLRISRVLRSLSLLGLCKQAEVFYERLEAIYRSRQYPLTAETFRYWTEAVGR